MSKRAWFRVIPTDWVLWLHQLEQDIYCAQCGSMLEYSPWEADTYNGYDGLPQRLKRTIYCPCPSRHNTSDTLDLKDKTLALVVVGSVALFFLICILMAAANGAGS